MLDAFREHKVAVFLGVLWAALFGLCLLFPYSGDDWAWGSQIGLDRLGRFFADYNGRYLGNLIVLALTRNVVLRSLVVSGVLVLIVRELSALAGRRRFSTLLVAAILLMLVHYRIGAQAIVWTSGFSNYAVPALLVLVYLNASKDMLAKMGGGMDGGETGAEGSAGAGIGEGAFRETGVRIAGMAVLGLCSSLIMENITLYNIVIACALIAYGKARSGCWSKAQIAFLAGALLGAALMFSNGAYWEIAASGGDGIRSFADGLTVEKLGHMVYYLVADSWAPLLCLLAVMAYRVFGKGTRAEGAGLAKRAERERRTEPSATATSADPTDNADPAGSADPVRSARLLLAALAFMSIVSLASVFALESPGLAAGLVVAAASAVFACALLAYCLARRREPLGRTCLLVIASIAIIVAPLLVVDPVGPRNFFPTYVLECALACILWDASIESESRLLTGVLGALLVVVLARWIAVYVPIHDADVARNDAVRAAAEAGEGRVTVPKLPNDGYVHTPDPTNGTWEHRYKLFHGFPQDLDIHLEEQTASR